jgi:hypothetical protein
MSEFCDVWVYEYVHVYVGFVMCGCMCGFCNMCVCVGVLVICMLVRTVLNYLYFVFVLFRLCILICFVWASIRTTATE